MKQALIIGDTGGIGRALCAQLVGEGYEVRGLSRSGDGLDFLDPTMADRFLADVMGPYDLICVASGALGINGAVPEKSMKALTAGAMLDQYKVNTLGPALVLRQAGRLLPRDRRAVVACLSARVGSIGDNRLGGWVSYRSAKAALNQVIRTAAIELTRTHPSAICVALHPGTVQTAFTQKYWGRHPADPPDVAARRLTRVMDGLVPAQTGGFYDYAGKEIPW